MGGGKDFLSGYNVHTIALQIPIGQVDTPSHTIGVWASTDRQNVTVDGKVRPGWTQVSRLGEPLINEVVIPTGLKDLWNRTTPAQRRAVQEVLRDPDPGRRAEQALQARRPGDGPRRPRRRARHGHPEGHLHGPHLRRRAPDQPRDPGHPGGEGEPDGRARRRQRRLPERPPARRRRRRHRGAGRRRLPHGQEGAPRRRRERERRGRTSATSPTSRPRTRATRTRRRPSRDEDPGARCGGPPRLTPGP